MIFETLVPLGSGNILAYCLRTFEEGWGGGTRSKTASVILEKQRITQKMPDYYLNLALRHELH